MKAAIVDDEVLKALFFGRDPKFVAVPKPSEDSFVRNVVAVTIDGVGNGNIPIPDSPFRSSFQQQKHLALPKKGFTAASCLTDVMLLADVKIASVLCRTVGEG